MLKRLAIVAIILIAAFCSWWFNKANLIVRAETPVFDVMWGSGPEHEHQIATLHKGEEFTVYACIDDKSYYGYEIKLPSGRTGYVLKGNTEIAQKSFVFPPYSQPIVWNCF